MNEKDYKDLRSLIKWHQEQVAELEGILEHESECKFHEKAVATLKKLLP